MLVRRAEIGVSFVQPDPDLLMVGEHLTFQQVLVLLLQHDPTGSLNRHHVLAERAFASPVMRLAPLPVVTVPWQSGVFRVLPLHGHDRACPTRDPAYVQHVLASHA